MPPSKSSPASTALAPGAVPPLDLELQFSSFPGIAAHRAVLRRRAVERWIAAALTVPAQLAVRIVGEEEARALNQQYRGRDYATNVLTFDLARDPVVMADIVLCGPVVEREAREQRKTLRAHYAHLLVHGALHAQGYDHELDEGDALEMETLEILLLGTLGFANPY